MAYIVANHSGKSHQAISEYDKRANCENQIGEVKRKGLQAIPTCRFMNNFEYFLIVLLAYNASRSFKMLAENSEQQNKAEGKTSSSGLSGIVDLSEANVIIIVVGFQMDIEHPFALGVVPS